MAHYGFILTSLLFCAAWSGLMAEDKNKFRGNVVVSLFSFLCLDCNQEFGILNNCMISAYLDMFLCVKLPGSDTYLCHQYKNISSCLSW